LSAGRTPTNRIKGNAAIRESSNVWLASFTNEWTAENASEKRMGESEAALAIVGNNGVFKVIKEKTNVIKRANENGPIDCQRMEWDSKRKVPRKPERNTGGAGEEHLTNYFVIDGAHFSFPAVLNSSLTRPGALRENNPNSCTLRWNGKISRKSDGAYTFVPDNVTVSSKPCYIAQLNHEH